MKTKQKTGAPVCAFCRKSGAGVQFAIFNPRFQPFGTACVECEKTVPAGATPPTSESFKLVPRREVAGVAVWMMFECGAGSRWTSTTEDHTGARCNFSGCNCNTAVKKISETNIAPHAAKWFRRPEAKEVAV